MNLELWSFGPGLDAAASRGMSVEARDGSVGNVENVVDQLGAAHLVVDMGGWFFGKTAVLPAGMVTAVDHDRRCVFIDCAIDDVKNAPKHDLDADYGAARESLGAYYGELRRAGRAEPDSPAVAVPDTASPRPHADASAALSSAAPEADVASHAQGAAARTGTGSAPTHGGAGVTGGRAAFGGSDESGEPPVVQAGPTAPAVPEHPGGGSREPLGAESTAEAPAPGDIDAPSRPSDALSPPESAEPTRPRTEATSEFGAMPSQPPSDGPAGARGEDEPVHGTTAPAGRDAAPQSSDERESAGDTQVPSEPVHVASANLSERGSERPDKARRTRRSTTGSEEGESKGTPRSRNRSRSQDGARESSTQVPIPRYDALNAAEAIARLRSLSQRELASLERYEQRHHGRQTVLSRIESLREDEPWRGYDDATVPEIKRKLADADEDRAKAVRDYERRHRDRKGVMEAARRIVA